MGLAQGVTELFPISSLGQAVILPTVLGWHSLVRAQSRPGSFFLAFLVGLHVASATALLFYFWNEWRGVIGGFLRMLEGGVRERGPPWAVLRTTNQGAGSLMVASTIPAGLIGVV